ncbi:MAG: hypothetical protein AAFX76_12215 [Planctomycetota bacterium]
MNTAASSAGVAAHQAAIAQATKAPGVVVRVSPRDFYHIVELNDEPLVVCAEGGFLRKTHQYLTSYRGLAFFTKDARPFALPDHAQVVHAERIWIPG